MISVAEQSVGSYFRPTTLKKGTNHKNNAFYQSLKASGLQKLAKTGGLDTNCDLKLLAPYFSQGKSILEVGAGYGRVIDYLLTYNFSKNITGIERCSGMHNYLKTRYKSNNNINLLQCDLFNLSQTITYKKFDVILWLWGGIYDFSPLEQQRAVEILSKLLNKNGTLILDTLTEGTTPLGAKRSGKITDGEYLLKSNNATIRVYGPSMLEIRQYAFLSGLSNVQHINFYTDTKRERALHVLS